MFWVILGGPKNINFEENPSFLKTHKIFSKYARSKRKPVLVWKYSKF